MCSKQVQFTLDHDLTSQSLKFSGISTVAHHSLIG